MFYDDAGEVFLWEVGRAGTPTRKKIFLPGKFVRVELQQLISLLNSLF